MPTVHIMAMSQNVEGKERSPDLAGLQRAYQTQVVWPTTSGQLEFHSNWNPCLMSTTLRIPSQHSPCMLVNSERCGHNISEEHRLQEG